MLDDLTGKLAVWRDELILLLPNLGVALAVLLVAWIASLLAANAVSRVMARISDQRALNELVRKLIRVGVMIAGFLIALNVLQLQEAAATFLAGAGIVGFALGFAFQDMTANFIAGVAMAIKRPMASGELVETNDQLGTVQRIELRSTWLETLDGKLVMIPNRKIFESTLVNLSRLGQRRVELEVGVSYGDDLDRVREVATEALETIKPRLERSVEVFFLGFGDSSVNFVARFWIEFRRQGDYMAARSAAVTAIRRAFAQHGITIPFPIRTLDFGIVGGEPLREHLAVRGREAP